MQNALQCTLRQAQDNNIIAQDYNIIARGDNIIAQDDNKIFQLEETIVHRSQNKSAMKITALFALKYY